MKMMTIIGDIIRETVGVYFSDKISIPIIRKNIKRLLELLLIFGTSIQISAW
jgi:hypothetical protein